MSKVFLIKKPRITEKNTLLQEQNKYIFNVDFNANKTEIKKEIKRLYNVDVLSVNIINIPAKKKRFGNKFFEKRRVKKAIVTLKDGQKIELV
jgi:large subunit ribosomal protein L23